MILWQLGLAVGAARGAASRPLANPAHESPFHLPALLSGVPEAETERRQPGFQWNAAFNPRPPASVDSTMPGQR